MEAAAATAHGRGILGSHRVQKGLGCAILAIGIAAGLISVSLTVYSYMPCPFDDEWSLIDGIARGNGPSNWAWLFGQHNEHRLVIPRLFVWFDVVAFRGRNVSLFVEIWLALVLHWAAICYVLERFTDFPNSLKWSLQGLFGFCIFHPNQSENLTWAFQIGFVLAFAVATMAILGVAFFRRFPRRHLLTFGVALAPVFAGWNLVGGLLVGPTVLCVAIAKRLPYRFILAVAATFLVSATLYFWRFRSPDPAHPPQAALANPKGILIYVLTYFGASWTRLLPHKERATALLSILYLAAIVVRAIGKRQRLFDFEQFCIAECIFLLSIACATAVGRLQFGVGQAFASRYQTPAMLYWGAMASLAVISVWRHRPGHLTAALGALLIVMLLSTLTFSRLWSVNSARVKVLQEACEVIIHRAYTPQASKTLHAIPTRIKPDTEFLRQLRAESNRKPI